jgi:predicted transcriptional regulator
MNTLKIGIASRAAYKKRTLAIAKGRHVPAKGEPKVWFDSLGTLAQLLSDQNRSLLHLILQKQPKSLHELAKVSGRAPSNLSRTLRTMERYGLVQLDPGPNRQIIPRVNYSGVEFTVSFQG